MKFLSKHRAGVTAALQEAQVPGSLVGKIATLIEKTLALGAEAEKRVEHFLGSFPAEKTPEAAQKS